MQAHNHESSTFALVTVTATVLGARPLVALALGLVGMWAADWPDIDAESSRIISMLFLVPWFPALLKLASSLVFDLCATEKDRLSVAGDWGPRFRVHRGLWHSVWGAAATGAGWWGLLAWAGTWRPDWEAAATDWLGLGQPAALVLGATLALGMVGHVCGDGCTDFAVAPLAPVLWWRGRRYVRMGLWEPLRFKVGKDVEKYLVTPICVGMVLWALLGTVLGPWSVPALSGLGIGVVWSLVPKRTQAKVLKLVLWMVPTKVLKKKVRKLLVVR